MGLYYDRLVTVSCVILQNMAAAKVLRRLDNSMLIKISNTLYCKTLKLILLILKSKIANFLFKAMYNIL